MAEVLCFLLVTALTIFGALYLYSQHPDAMFVDFIAAAAPFVIFPMTGLIALLALFVGAGLWQHSLLQRPETQRALEDWARHARAEALRADPGTAEDDIVWTSAWSASTLDKRRTKLTPMSKDLHRHLRKRLFQELRAQIGILPACAFLVIGTSEALPRLSRHEQLAALAKCLPDVPPKAPSRARKHA